MSKTRRDCRFSLQNGPLQIAVRHKAQKKSPCEHRRRTELRRMDGKPFRFECTGCGNCCRGRGEVYFTEQDMRNVEKLLELKPAEKPAFRRKMVQTKRNGLLVHLTNGRCSLLGADNRCSVYQARPIQCRTYPFWAGFFENEDDMEFLKNECEGVGRKKAQVYSPLAIKRRTNKTEREFRALQTGKEPFSL